MNPPTTPPLIRSRCSSFCRERFDLPHIRFARTDLVELTKRANEETNLAINKGLQTEINILNSVSNTACLAICVPLKYAMDAAKTTIYMNRYKQTLGGTRKPDNQDNDKRRLIVDNNLFTNFHEKIYYASLAHKGYGLTNYGEVVFYIENNITLETRAALLEENSYIFFKRHNIGFNKLDIPAGFRSDWQNRDKLVAAKLAKKIKKGLKVNDIKSILLQSGINTYEDDFIEAHIYTDSFEVKLFSECQLLVKGKTREDEMCWELTKYWLKETDIKVVD